MATALDKNENFIEDNGVIQLFKKYKTSWKQMVFLNFEKKMKLSKRWSCSCFFYLIQKLWPKIEKWKSS